MLGLSYTFVTPGTSPTFFNNITTVFINRKDKSPVSQYAINSSSLPARFLWPWWLHKHQIMAGSNAHRVCLRFSSDKREWENTLRVVIISLLISISFIISRPRPGSWHSLNVQVSECSSESSNDANMGRLCKGAQNSEHWKQKGGLCKSWWRSLYKVVRLWLATTYKLTEPVNFWSLSRASASVLVSFIKIFQSCH